MAGLKGGIDGSHWFHANRLSHFGAKKAPGLEREALIVGSQQLSRFESSESATVARRAVTGTTRWAALLARGADAEAVPSVLVLTKIGKAT